MSFGILRRFLNLRSSNSKCTQLRRFVNTAAFDHNPPHNRKRKLNGGSQFRDAVSVQDPSEIQSNHRRTKILMGIALAGLFLVHELISRADAESLKRKLVKESPLTDEEYEILKEDWRIHIEQVKVRDEEADKEHKLLLQELKELKRDKSGPNI